MNNNYEKKYLKYKIKYNNLKYGGGFYNTASATVLGVFNKYSIASAAKYVDKATNAIATAAAAKVNAQAAVTKIETIKNMDELLINENLYIQKIYDVMNVKATAATSAAANAATAAATAANAAATYAATAATKITSASITPAADAANSAADAAILAAYTANKSLEAVTKAISDYKSSIISKALSHIEDELVKLLNETNLKDYIDTPYNYGEIADISNYNNIRYYSLIKSFTTISKSFPNSEEINMNIDVIHIHIKFFTIREEFNMNIDVISLMDDNNLEKLKKYWESIKSFKLLKNENIYKLFKLKKLETELLKIDLNYTLFKYDSNTSHENNITIIDILTKKIKNFVEKEIKNFNLASTTSIFKDINLIVKKRYDIIKSKSAQKSIEPSYDPLKDKYYADWAANNSGNYDPSEWNRSTAANQRIASYKGPDSAYPSIYTYQKVPPSSNNYHDPANFASHAQDKQNS